VSALADQEVEPWDDDDLDAIEALMTAAPAGDTGGRTAAERRPTTSPDKDGEAWGPSHKSLDVATLGVAQWAAQGGGSVYSAANWWDHGMTTDLEAGDSDRTLTRKELGVLDQAAIRAVALAQMGFTEDDMFILDRAGMSAAKQVLQARWEERLLQVQEAGGRMSDLERALGWTATSKRMRKALARARARREDQDKARAA
jgi:hypothetical protein